MEKRTRSKADERAPSLSTYLAEKRAAVERALDNFMPASDAVPARLHGAMRHSVFSGGKRLRPILALSAFEVLEGSGDAVMAPACATELIHTYSLIHDDLPSMDDDETRRGRPTCHRAFDEATAILAGDALLTLAFEIVMGEDRLEPERRVAIAEELSRANGHAGMAGGQAVDLESEGLPPSIDLVRYIHTHKTGEPIRAAVLVGALAAGADAEGISALSAYGERIGMAFQIADDLLDETGTEESMGKAVRKDAARGKQTYPAVAGIEGSRAAASALLEEALAALSRFGAGAWPLRAIARYIVERDS
jgi:geranylgeranyl diphosphate synthase, type II